MTLSDEKEKAEDELISASSRIFCEEKKLSWNFYTTHKKEQ